MKKYIENKNSRMKSELKKKTINILIEAEFRDKLDAIARRKHDTVSHIVRLLVIDYIENESALEGI